MNILINEDLGCSISQNIPISLDLTPTDEFQGEIIAYPSSVFPTSQVLLIVLPKPVPAPPRPPSRTPKIAPPSPKRPPSTIPEIAPPPPVKPQFPPVKKDFP